MMEIKLQVTAVTTSVMLNQAGAALSATDLHPAHALIFVETVKSWLQLWDIVMTIILLMEMDAARLVQLKQAGIEHSEIP